MPRACASLSQAVSSRSEAILPPTRSMAQRVAAPLPIPSPSGSGVPELRTVEPSEALRRDKVLPAVVYRTEAFQVEVLLVYGIARYCLVVPASKCDKPENISHASFEQLGQ
jgi:hypothetical protein